MIQRIPNPFREIYKSFSTDKMMDLLKEQIMSLGTDIQGKLNYESMDDFMDRSCDISDNIWSFVIMMAFKDEEFLDVAEFDDLPEDLPIEFLMEVLPGSVIPLAMLPEEVRHELMGNSALDQASLSNPNSWFN